MVRTYTTLITATICLMSQVSSVKLHDSTSIDLLRRADLTCSAPNTNTCGNGLPGNFCCPSDSKCIVLASNTTGLCCPSGRDCTTLSPILCDIQQQNVTAFPGTSLMTTNLTSLPTCGTACCPFGYSCIDGSCHMNTNQNSNAPSSIPTTSPTTTVTLPTSTPSIPASASSASSTAAVGTPLQSQPSEFTAKAVLVGFFPGLFLGIAATILFILCLGARRAKKEAKSPSSPFGRIQASISDPIYNGHNSTIMRSFSLRPSNKSAASPGAGNQHMQRVRSLFQKSANANGVQLTDSPSPRFASSRANIPPVPQIPSSHQNHDEMREIPITPYLQREPSMEEINIFADPRTVSRTSSPNPAARTPNSHLDSRVLVHPNGGLQPPSVQGLGIGHGKGLGTLWDPEDERRQTTFTELMDHADLGSVRRCEVSVKTPTRVPIASVMPERGGGVMPGGAMGENRF